MKPPTRPPISRAATENAAATLGASLDELRLIDVQRAFRRAVRAAHPDTGVDPSEAADLIAQARQARITLIRWIDEQPSPECSVCKGRGSVRAGALGSRPCPACV